MTGDLNSHQLPSRPPTWCGMSAPPRNRGVADQADRRQSRVVDFDIDDAWIVQLPRFDAVVHTMRCKQG